jgi:hypothetical protein
MFARDYIQSVIVCDEVRTEMSGKDIAIGIYNGHMVVPQIPFIVPMLTVRHEFHFHGDIKNSLTLKMEDPNKNSVFQQTMPIRFNDWDKPGAISVILGGLILPAEGQYTFHLKFDGDWELSRTFFVEKFDQDKIFKGWQEQMKHMEETIRRAAPVDT